MEPRTLRCANGRLYLGFVLGIIAAAVYVAVTRHFSIAELIGIAALCVVALIWGGYYVTLRYIIDAEGVTQRLFFRSHRLLWSELTAADVQEKHSPGVESCTLVLTTAGSTLSLSSDILNPDEVHDLVEDMRTAGLLKQQDTAGN